MQSGYAAMNKAIRTVERSMEQRVELNAMTITQLVALIERKLREGGVAKVIPEPPILEEAYRRVVMRIRLSRPLGKLRAEVGRDVAAIVMPDDLLSCVADNPRALAGRLRRAATFLRKVGEVTFGREGRARTRTIRIIAAPENTGAQPSASSAFMLNSNSANDVADAFRRTVANDADGTDEIRGPPTIVLPEEREARHG